jgi:hypothetical protein
MGMGVKTPLISTMLSLISTVYRTKRSLIRVKMKCNVRSLNPNK